MRTAAEDRMHEPKRVRPGSPLELEDELAGVLPAQEPRQHGREGGDIDADHILDTSSAREARLAAFYE
jgi:hypothetical protein